MIMRVYLDGNEGSEEKQEFNDKGICLWGYRRKAERKGRFFSSVFLRFILPDKNDTMKAEDKAKERNDVS